MFVIGFTSTTSLYHRPPCLNSAIYIASIHGYLLPCLLDEFLVHLRGRGTASLEVRDEVPLLMNRRPPHFVSDYGSSVLMSFVSRDVLVAKPRGYMTSLAGMTVRFTIQCCARYT